MDSIVSNRFLFSFEGRINRLKYWYALFASLISGLFFLFVLAFAIGVIFGAGVESVELNPFDIFAIPPSFPFRASFSDAGPGWKATLISVSFYAAGTPIFVVSMWFLAATTIKRLHDRDRSGWWVVPFFIAPSLLIDIWAFPVHANAAIFFTIVAVALTICIWGLVIWGLVELLLLRGTRRPNRFGSDPLAPIDTRPGWHQQSEIEFVPHSAGPSPASHVKPGHE
jgi:uncharacterized membrane protein YhaH (DUF805 family)